MSGYTNQIACDLDFDEEGRQVGLLALHHSDNEHAYGIIQIPIAILKRGEGPTLLLSAGNHGDEYLGQIVLRRLIHELPLEELQGRVIALPALNAPAARAGARISPLDQGNLNRSFPGDAAGPPTRAIAHFVTTELVPLADAGMDLHCGGTASEYLPSTFLCRAPEAGLMARQIAMVEAFGAPDCYVVARDTSNSGYDPHAQAQGVAFVSTELGGGQQARPEVLEIGYRGVLGVLRMLEMLPPDPEAPAPRRPRYLAPAANGSVMAPFAGLFEPAARLGDRVAAGQPAGRLYAFDEPDRPPLTLAFQNDGIVLTPLGFGPLGFDALVLAALGFGSLGCDAFFLAALGFGSLGCDAFVFAALGFGSLDLDAFFLAALGFGSLGSGGFGSGCSSLDLSGQAIQLARHALRRAIERGERPRVEPLPNVRRGVEALEPPRHIRRRLVGIESGVEQEPLGIRHRGKDLAALSGADREHGPQGALCMVEHRRQPGAGRLRECLSFVDEEDEHLSSAFAASNGFEDAALGELPARRTELEEDVAPEVVRFEATVRDVDGLKRMRQPLAEDAQHGRLAEPRRPVEKQRPQTFLQAAGEVLEQLFGRGAGLVGRRGRGRPEGVGALADGRLGRARQAGLGEGVAGRDPGGECAERARDAFGGSVEAEDQVVVEAQPHGVGRMRSVEVLPDVPEALGLGHRGPERDLLDVRRQRAGHLPARVVVEAHDATQGTFGLDEQARERPGGVERQRAGLLEQQHQRPPVGFGPQRGRQQAALCGTRALLRERLEDLLGEPSHRQRAVTDCDRQKVRA